MNLKERVELKWDVWTRAKLEFKQMTNHVTCFIWLSSLPTTIWPQAQILEGIFQQQLEVTLIWCILYMLLWLWTTSLILSWPLFCTNQFDPGTIEHLTMYQALWLPFNLTAFFDLAQLNLTYEGNSRHVWELKYVTVSSKGTNAVTPPNGFELVHKFSHKFRNISATQNSCSLIHH